MLIDCDVHLGYETLAAEGRVVAIVRDGIEYDDLAAVPEVGDTPAPRATRVRGELPSPIDPPSGCRFRTRCPLATELCAQVEPVLETVSDARQVACHFSLQTKEARP